MLQIYYTTTFGSNIKSVYFLGNAPTVVIGAPISSFDYSTTLYYYEGMEGWTTPTWNGYNTVALPMSETDTEPPVVAINTPSADSTVAGKDLIISGTATDNRILSKVDLSYSLDNGANYTSIASLANDNLNSQNSFNWTYTFDASKLPSGAMIIKAVAHDASGNQSEAKTAVTLKNSTMDVVKDFDVTSTSRYIFMSWNYDMDTAKDDFGNFLIYRGTSKDGPFKCVSTQKTLDFYDADTSLKSGETYYYYVTAKDKYGHESEASEVLSAVLIGDSERPLIKSMNPDDNTLVFDSAKIQVSATDNYRLGKLLLEYRAVGASDCTEMATITVDEAIDNKTFDYTWDVSTLSAGKYQIRASVYDASINDVGICSSYVANSPATMTKPITIGKYSSPEAPALNTTSGYKSISLKWSYSGDSSLLSTYNIYRSTSENGQYNLIKAVSVAATSYTDKVSTGDTYYYKVEAVDIRNAMAISNISSSEAGGFDSEAPVAVISPESLVAATGVAFQFSGVNSTDNDAVASYYWEFGDGETSTDVTPMHTYDTEGNFIVKLTVTDASGNKNTASADMTVVDVTSKDATYTLSTFSVVDASVAGTPGIANATIYVSSEDPDWKDSTAVTDKDGIAKVLLRRGYHTVSVTADSYMPRTTSLEVLYTENGTAEFQIGMSATSLLAGEITSKEMTYDEIVAAGIDVSDPDNQHVWKFEVILEFVAGLKTFEFPITVGYKNKAEKFTNDSGGWYDFALDGEDGLGGGDGKIGIFPMPTEGFYLIIYGEAHWLKEMYNVELLIINNSFTDEIADCTAELVLPEGLSLASLLHQEQKAAIDLDTIYTANTNFNSQTAKWYVMGDAEGEYYLSANVNGEYRNGGISEPFAATFTTSSPIKVYAGSALKMTIIADDIAERGEDYDIVLQLENTSDKPLYNVSFGITGVEQIKVISFAGKDGFLPIDSFDFGDSMFQTIPELRPGDYYQIGLRMTIQFNSALELVEKFIKYTPETQLLGTFIDVVYYLQNVSVLTLEGSTTLVPHEVVINHTERPHIIKSVFTPLWKRIKGEEPPSSSMDNLIEIFGYNLPVIMKAGTKSIMSLQQGATNYDIRLSLHDAQGNANAYYNDRIQITSGSELQIFYDTMNNSYIKVDDLSNFTITGLKSGESTIDFSIKGDGLDIKYTTSIIVNDEKIETTFDLKQDLNSGKFAINGDLGKQIIKQLQKTEGETFADNPYLWFGSYLNLCLTGEPGSLEAELLLDKKIFADIISETVLSNLQLNSDIAHLNLDKETLDKILASDSEYEAINIAIKKLGEDVAREKFGMDAPTYEFFIRVGEESFTEFGDGEVEISIPYTLKDGENVNDIEVHRIKDYDSYEIVQSEYDSAEGLVKFTTDSFSYYRIASNGGSSSSGSGSSSSGFNNKTNTDTIGGSTVSTPSGKKPVKNDDGSVTLPGGGTIKVDGSAVVVSAPNGTVVGKDGGVTIPDKKAAEITLSGSDAKINVPGGAVIDAKGKIVIGSGDATMTLSNGTEISLPTGTTIAGNKITVGSGGATAKAKDQTVTIKEGEVLTLDKNNPFGYSIDSTDPDYNNPFIDIKDSDWFYNAVKYAYENDVMHGTSSTTFEPNTKLSRAMLVQLLYNYEKHPNPKTAVFDDVDSGAWYADAVAWAAGNGIVNGVGNNLFAPDSEITREQMAVMLYNYCIFKGIDTPVKRTSSTFTDVGTISDWAVKAVTTMYQAEIIDGKGDGIFDPKGTATRAEVAQLFMNFTAAIK